MLALPNGLSIEESVSQGYKARTYKNAEADVTIAIAKNFETAGEKCTRNAVVFNKKVYIATWFRTTWPSTIIDEMVRRLNRIPKTSISVNIAGNGLYTFKDLNQDEIDFSIFQFLRDIIDHPDFDKLITSVHSGGQTGIDEAGIKAAIKLGIPAVIIAPRFFVFRDKNGIDHTNEFEFKKRFVMEDESDS